MNKKELNDSEKLTIAIKFLKVIKNYCNCTELCNCSTTMADDALVALLEIDKDYQNE